METYILPQNRIKYPETRAEVQENVIYFLLVNQIPIKDTWTGRMRVKHQRSLLGFDLGRCVLSLSREGITGGATVSNGERMVYPYHWNLSTGELIFGYFNRGVVNDTLDIIQMRGNNHGEREEV